MVENVTGGRVATVADMVCGPATCPKVQCTVTCPSVPLTAPLSATVPLPCALQATLTPGTGCPCASWMRTTSGCGSGWPIAPVWPSPETSASTAGCVRGFEMSPLQ